MGFTKESGGDVRGGGVYVYWLPVAMSRTSYCDRYWPHLHVHQMQSTATPTHCTPARHTPEARSHRAHFAAITAVAHPLQAGGEALVVDEDLRRVVCAAV